MYNAWFGLEGSYLCEQLRRKTKPIMWMASESDRADGLVCRTTAIFSVPSS
jgi:hypothetical protein